jgi:hypothetical protein
MQTLLASTIATSFGTIKCPINSPPLHVLAARKVTRVQSCFDVGNLNSQRNWAKSRHEHREMTGDIMTHYRDTYEASQA